MSHCLGTECIRVPSHESRACHCSCNHCLLAMVPEPSQQLLARTNVTGPVRDFWVGIMVRIGEATEPAPYAQGLPSYEILPGFQEVRIPVRATSRDDARCALRLALLSLAREHGRWDVKTEEQRAQDEGEEEP